LGTSPLRSAFTTAADSGTAVISVPLPLISVHGLTTQQHFIDEEDVTFGMQRSAQRPHQPIEPAGVLL
jgi:hypothetical protein